MTNDEIRGFIENAIKENKVMLFMKGTPQQPACGFSMRTSGALNALGVKYAALDILPDPRIREELSGLSGWPTIPQLFVDGELVGGCDIVMEMFESGELAETLGVEQPDLAEAPDEPEHELPQRQSDRAREPPGLGGRGLRAAGELLEPLPTRRPARPPAPILVDREPGADARLDVEDLVAGVRVHGRSVPPGRAPKNAASRCLKVRYSAPQGAVNRPLRLLDLVLAVPAAARRHAICAPQRGHGHPGR